jgi:hypothetical protein
MSSYTRSAQGIICLSPAVDCPRNFLLKIMEAIQGIVLLVVPNARLIPQPQIPDITLNEAEVGCAFLSPTSLFVNDAGRASRSFTEKMNVEKDCMLIKICTTSTPSVHCR